MVDNPAERVADSGVETLAVNPAERVADPGVEALAVNPAERLADPGVEALHQHAADGQHPEADDDSENAEIDLLMQSAQEHDERDESRRVRAGEYRPVTVPVSRALFPLAKARGSKIIFAPNQ